MTYRADIDGLRAVSVLSVALFHANITMFAGGFIGVDVFFVISGYLITGIVYGQLSEGRFSLVDFWERRVRRIAPAMLAMALFVALFTLAFKTPNETRTFGESVSFFGLLASNHFFLQERGYFDAPREAFALLHTWSLAVEEQFYLVFPPLMLLLFTRLRERLIAVLVAIAAVSFVVACYIVILSIDDVERTADFAFFFSPLRAWELMFGAILAIVKPDPTRLTRSLREALAWLGLALVIAPVFLYNEHTPFPGPTALPPCLGAALLIYTGGAETVARRLLSWAPIVFIGLASYSFYLWHWPALSFAEYYAMRPLTTLEALAAVAMSFGVAVLSLYCIERPFRRPGGVFKRRPLFVVAGLSFASAIALGVALQETKGLPQRFSPEIVALSTGESHEFGVERADCPGERGRLTAEERKAIYVMFCRTGDVEKTPEILLWGDSHALSASPAFQGAAQQMGVSVLVTSRAACAPVAGFAWKHLSTRIGCLAHNDAMMGVIDRLDVKTVILVASWGDYASAPDGAPEPEEAEKLTQSLRAMLERLQAKGIEVRVVLSVPVFEGVSVPSMAHRTAVFGTSLAFDRSRALHENWQAPEKQILEQLSDDYGLPLLRLDDFLCKNGECRVLDDVGLPLYADGSHINLRGAGLLTDLVAEWLAR